MKLFYKILFCSSTALFFTSCLKDDRNLIDPANTNNVVEFANTANLVSPTTSRYPLLSVNIPMLPSVTYNAVVSYSGANNAPEDITVEVDVADPSIITAYNTQNRPPVPFVPVPTTLYSIPTKTVVIQKGTRQVNLPITFTNSNLLFAQGYALALTIKSVRPSNHIISGNFNTMLYSLNGINQLDGIYTLKYRFGTNDRNFDITPVTWFYSDVTLVTASVNTSTMRNLNAGTSVTTGVHAATSIGLPTSIPTFVPLLTYDLASLRITNITNNTTTSPRTAVPNPLVTDNRLDAASKTVFASFLLRETGRPDMIINDTLIYKSPR